MNGIMNIGQTSLKTAGSYIDELSGQLSKNTRNAYIGDIKSFFGVEDTSDLTMDMVRSVTTSDVNIYAEKLYNDGLSNSTINRKLQSLSKFYTLLMRRDIKAVEYNPFDSKEGAVRFKATTYSKGLELTTEDIKLMVQEAKKDVTVSGARNLIILYMLLTTGMRREEIASLTVGQISRTQGKYIIDFTGKGRKERFVVLADEIKSMIDNYLSLRGIKYTDKQEPLFVSHAKNADQTKSISTETIYQLIKTLAKNAGLDPSISPHDFRHTYVTSSLEMGVPIETVQDRVGHSDVKTTRRYDHTLRVLRDNPADSIFNMYK